MQRAEQREQAAGGVEIDGDLALEPLLQRRLPSSCSPRRPMSIASILDAGCVLIAGSSSRRSGNSPSPCGGTGVSDSMMLDRRAARRRHLKTRRSSASESRSAIGAGVVALQREAVFLEEIEDGDLALMLDLGRCAADRGFVERRPRSGAPRPANVLLLSFIRAAMA